ncbi:NUDIX domain-containing protein [Actinosynnema sp. NPDC023587]|uniref:NUDIX hydrolase n=1 Tax=Actinosynnema sp. NPDC023587 TaxID=3154695 RepID=UPI0033D78F9F
MTAPDIAWKTAGNSYKLRAAGLVVHDGQLLVCYADVVEGCFPPGGKVRFGESATEAVHRELVEELGVSFEAGELALVAECVYDDDGVLHHEVCFYFRLGWPAGLPPDVVGQILHEEQSFGWVPLAALPDHGFTPPEILPHLSGRGGPTHLAFDRRA